MLANDVRGIKDTQTQLVDQVHQPPDTIGILLSSIFHKEHFDETCRIPPPPASRPVPLQPVTPTIISAPAPTGDPGHWLQGIQELVPRGALLLVCSDHQKNPPFLTILVVPLWIQFTF